MNAVAAHTVAGVARRAQRGKGKAQGDWLIRTKNGTLCICPEADFEDHYVKVEDFTPEVKPEPKRKVKPDAE